MYQLDKTGRVITLSTFSKIFAPGFRVGWAIEKNVAFVSGTTFFCDGSGHNTMRLNFSFSNNEEIESGVKRLALVIAEELSNYRS